MSNQPDNFPGIETGASSSEGAPSVSSSYSSRQQKKKSSSGLIVLLCVGGGLALVALIVVAVVVLGGGVSQVHKDRIVAYIEENNPGATVAVSSWETESAADPVGIRVEYQLSGNGMNESHESIFMLGEQDDEIGECTPEEWPMMLMLYKAFTEAGGEG